MDAVNGWPRRSSGVCRNALIGGVGLDGDVQRDGLVIVTWMRRSTRATWQVIGRPTRRKLPVRDVPRVSVGLAAATLLR